MDPSPHPRHPAEGEKTKELVATSKGSSEEDPNLVTYRTDITDPSDPLNWTTRKKWRTILIISLSAFCVTCTSSVVTSAYGGIEREFGVSHEVAILGLSLFVIGLGIGPLLLGPLSEFYGRRPIYLVSYTSFFLLGLPVSFANNAPVFLLFRFITGFCGSAFLSIAGGTVSDLFTRDKVFIPMAVYTNSPFLGPVAGPLISGFINQNSNWRWTFYLINIWSLVMVLVLFLLAPETFSPIILTKKAKELRNQTGNLELYSKHEVEIGQKSLLGAIAVSSTKPFKLLFYEYMLTLLCVWSALLLGILYLLFEAFPIVFEKHGFQLQEVGMTFIGIGVGMALALSSMPYWSKRYDRAVMESGGRGGQAQPEERLPVGMVGAILMPLGMFWFSFTTYPSIPWIVPILASIPIGAGISLIYMAVFTYTVDAYRPVAASAMAANSAVRSSFAFFFPLFANQMYRNLGTVGASALLAGLNVLMIPLPFVFYRYGSRIRARSRFTMPP
ncbi:MFS general substrate transporter [Violaceomyces palustris]|uniref:MFS general substrate transporter n=1 Tax=Violaceomyces palustris TaxID=1673888 RepID=A0ACD0NLC9_9BASI|nr:MFS general substrate transporter [Violaceomyces palustris]